MFLQDCWLERLASDFRVNWKLLQKAGRQEIILNSHWSDLFIASEQLYIEQTGKKSNVLYRPSYKTKLPFSLLFLKLPQGTEEYFIHPEKLKNISFIPQSSIYPKDTGFTLGAIPVTVYKFTLRLWAFLLKSKTEYGHLLWWLLYYLFLSEDQSLELISVYLSRHREKYCQKRIKKRLIFILCVRMLSLHLCL